jgi:hypothetical protein
MNTLQDVIGVPVSFHVVLWHGKQGPSLTGYQSGDPDVIGDQLTSMLNYGGPDTGVIALTYGPTVSSFIHNACMEMSLQCADRNMPFALCFDPWTCSLNGVKYTAQTDKDNAMIAALKHPDTQTMFNRRSYMAGHPVLDFATGCDKTTILAAVPGIEYWLNGPDFAWPRIPGPTNNNVAQLPCVCLQFNDGTGTNRNMSWDNQTQPVRIIPSMAGTYFESLISSIPKSANRIQVVTWNDVNESTDLESFASTLL